MTVHRYLGPGFLESIYQRAMCFELHSRTVPFERDKAVAVRYREHVIPGQRIDLVVADQVIVEVKAVQQLNPVHEAQVLSYLKTTGLRVGLLMNFNVALLKQGLKRIVL